jgi:hypothetical protein
MDSCPLCTEVRRSTSRFVQKITVRLVQHELESHLRYTGQQLWYRAAKVRSKSLDTVINTLIVFLKELSHTSRKLILNATDGFCARAFTTIFSIMVKQSVQSKPISVIHRTKSMVEQAKAREAELFTTFLTGTHGRLGGDSVLLKYVSSCVAFLLYDVFTKGYIKE